MGQKDVTVLVEDLSIWVVEAVLHLVINLDIYVHLD